MKPHVILTLAALLWQFPAAADDPGLSGDGLGQWFEWRGEADTTSPSAIDLSGWLEKPAGRRGRITREGDELRYGGEPIKLWGINVNYAACAPPRDVAERQARFYAKYGINTVRLHKYADGPRWQGILTDRSFVEFDPEKLDRLDYYVAQLKGRGIYTKLSAVFGSTRIGPDDLARAPFADEFPDKKPEGWVTAPQGATYYCAELQDLHIEQVVKMLRHTNPYTRQRHADDPAVAFVELINENSITFFSLRAMQMSPTVKRRAGEAFFAWLQKKYGDEDALRRAWGAGAINCFVDEGMVGEGWHAGVYFPVGNGWFFDPAQLEGAMKDRRQRLLDTMAFFYDQQNAFYDRFVDAIRDTGYAGEITASNWQAGRSLSHFLNLHSDARIGLIDRHNYFNGPSSMLATPGGGLLSAGMQQVEDRPFMLSEWIHVFPSEYGVEGPAILGAYGMGLNGWDVSYIFQNRDDGRFRPELKQRWDAVAPQVLGIFPAVARQVLRGDVGESDLTFVRNVHVPSLTDAGEIGFDDRVEQVYDVKTFTSDTTPAATLAVGRSVVRFTDEPRPTEQIDMADHTQDGVIRSATGQLSWRPGASSRDGYFTIDSPGTQAVVGFADGVAVELADVTITTRSPYAAVYVSALNPTGTIADDQGLLVTTLARVRNTAMRFVDGEMVEPGRPPMLVEPVAVELRLKRGGGAVAYVLDHDGRRTSRKVESEGDTLRLDSATTHAIYYEIVYR